MKDLLNLAWPDILGFFLVFVRVGVIFSIVPFFSAEIIPRRIVAIISFMLSLILLPVVPMAHVNSDNIGVFYILMLLFHEFLVGLCLGLAIDIIFAGIQMAGQLAGFQMGFAIVNVIDPMTGVNAPVTSNFLYIVSFLVFLVLDGHYLLIKGMVESFRLIPIDIALPSQGFLFAPVAYGAKMFIIALKVSAPVIGVLLLVNVAFALVARAVPQMNVFLMSFPIVIIAGLISLIVVLKLLAPVLSISLGHAWRFMVFAMSNF